MRSICLDNFSLVLGRRTIFREVSATLDWRAEAPEVVALMGPSGSGKTTLVRAVVDHRYIRRMPGIAITPPDVVLASVPQVPILFPHLDARANARLFRSAGRYRSRFDESLYTALIETLRMGSVLRDNKDVASLSGGEAQRLMLIRTLSIRPDLLTMDEPCTGLDASVRESFLVDLIDVVRRFGVSLLYVSHHWSEIAAIASRVAYLRAPRDDADGAVRTIQVKGIEDFLERPPTVEAFESVYGLGTSVWPLAGETDDLLRPERPDLAARRVACFAPVGAEAGARSFVRMGPFRISRMLLEGSGETPARAWIYRDGDLERAAVSVRGVG